MGPPQGEPEHLPGGGLQEHVGTVAEGGPVGGSCPPHPLSGREQSGGLLACRGTRPPSRGAWPLGGAETSAGRPGRFGAPPRLCGEHGPGGRGCTSSRAGGRSVRCCRPPLCRWPLPRPHPGRWVAGDRGCPSLQCRILPKATVIQTQAKLCPVSCSAPPAPDVSGGPGQGATGRAPRPEGFTPGFPGPRRRSLQPSSLLLLGAHQAGSAPGWQDQNLPSGQGPPGIRDGSSLSDPH